MSEVQAEVALAELRPDAPSRVAQEGGEGQAYLDIVWRQFRKNRPAFYSLWVIGALFLVAIFAPLLASNVPLAYRDEAGTIYPWFHSLFHTAEAVDYAFNMILVGFFPWVVVALATNWWARRRGMKGRRRLALIGLELLVITAATCALGKLALPQTRDEFSWRDFPEEQFKKPNDHWAFYPLIPFGQSEQDIDSRVLLPGKHLEKNLSKSNQTVTHWLGTAYTGEDVLAQMIYGTRIAMTVGFVAVALEISIGVALGALAGYFGGWIDILISRLIEIVTVFPAFFLILTLVGLIGPDIYVIMLVIGITSWTGIARLTRGEVLKQRALDYTAAAQALGTSHLRIIFRHILPNSLSPALVTIPFSISGAIVTEAGLSLLGFGIRPPTPSWGTILQTAEGNYGWWWLIVFPSLAIFLTVTVFNLVGNGLRDAMDPRLRI